MYIAENEAILRNVLAAYDFPDTPIGVVRYGSGQVTYVEPCSAAYAVFGELQVLSIEITVELLSGQTTVGLSANLYSGQINP